MMTEIGEITVGTLLKRVRSADFPFVTYGNIYQVAEVSEDGDIIILDNFETEWVVKVCLYEIVGHIDDDIIEELDQMLEFCLMYNELESYIVRKA